MQYPGTPKIRIRCFCLIVLLVMLIFALFPQGSAAHEIPSDVTVLVFVKPAGARLHVLARVPIESLQGVEWKTRGPGYLDLRLNENMLREVATIWVSNNLNVFETDTRLSTPAIEAVRISLPSDRSFVSYETALAHLLGPSLSTGTDLHWQQGVLDVFFSYSIRSDSSNFSIDPSFERLGVNVVTMLRFLAPNGAVRAFQLPGAPGLVLLDPSWYQAALRFIVLGFWHILDGIDHLLFLFCLVIPFQRVRSLLLIVTSFTFAHSITLIASAIGFAPNSLWFPPLIESIIAFSILYMALENILGAKVERRLLVTFGFGLIHGFGFSFALQETLQFAGSHMLMSLVSFNVGVELGQILVLVIIVPALSLLLHEGLGSRLGVIILSVLIAHTSWHWMTERLSILSHYSFPQLTVGGLASSMRWLMLMLILGGIIWLLSIKLKGWIGRDSFE